MAEPLYKYLDRRSAKVEKIPAVALQYETNAPRSFSDSEIQLIADYEIGIEIEVENVNAHTCTEYVVWQMHNDGSLRNSGYEYVTIPIKGKRIVFALNQFFGTMSPTISFSPRTSIHIHLNVLDMTPHQIGTLLMVYLVHEKLFYQFVGGCRDRNNFCVPMLDSSWDKMLKTFLGESFIVPQMDQYRYMGLNVAALRKFGTLEFRHLGGTKDITKILKWINLIFCLKQFAMRQSWEDVKARIGKLNDDSRYLQFFNDVFGPCGYYLNSWNLQKDMETAVSRVKRLLISNSFKRDLNALFTKQAVWYSVLCKLNKELTPDSIALQPELRQSAVRGRRLDGGLFARPIPVAQQEVEIDLAEDEPEDVEEAAPNEIPQFNLQEAINIYHRGHGGGGRR